MTKIDMELFRKQTAYEYDSEEARETIGKKKPAAEGALDEARGNLNRAGARPEFITNVIKETNAYLARLVKDLQKYPAGREASGQWRGAFRAMLLGAGRKVELISDDLRDKELKAKEPTPNNSTVAPNRLTELKLESERESINDKFKMFTEQVGQLAELVGQLDDPDKALEFETMHSSCVDLASAIKKVADMNDLDTAQALGEMEGLLGELTTIYERKTQIQKRKAA